MEVNSKMRHTITSKWGTFVFKPLLAGGRALVGRQVLRYTEGHDIKSLPGPEASLIYAMASLDVAAVERPPDFSWDDVSEEDLFALYKGFADWQDSFRRRVPEEQETVGAGAE